MACDPLVFSGVDASNWATVRDSVSREYGIRIDSEQGEATQRGFTLKWAYEPSEQTLLIQCSSKPFLIPCGAVNKRITDMAEKCGITRA